GAGQVKVLDLLGGLLITHPTDRGVVVVLLLAAHAADVERGVCPGRIGTLRRVVTDHDGDGQDRVERARGGILIGVGAVGPAPLNPVDAVAHTVRRGEDAEPAVGDATGELKV